MKTSSPRPGNDNKARSGLRKTVPTSFDKNIRVKFSSVDPLPKFKPQDFIQRMLPIDSSLMLSAAASQRYYFIEGSTPPSVEEVQELRRLLNTQFEMFLSTIEDQEMETVETHDDFSDSYFFNAKDDSPINSDSYSNAFVPVYDKTLLGYDLAVKLACHIKHSLDKESTWYWQPTEQLVTPGSAPLVYPSKATSTDDADRSTPSAPNHITEYIREAAVETLPAIRLHNHLEKALDWDLASLQSPATALYLNGDVRIILAMLIDEVCSRTDFQGEDVSPHDRDSLLRLARQAIELEIIQGIEE